MSVVQPVALEAALVTNDGLRYRCTLAALRAKAVLGGLRAEAELAVILRRAPPTGMWAC
jgi:hypothetical protein